jgi:peptidoglycan/LPS O-acetylase OafA/YrhL
MQQLSFYWLRKSLWKYSSLLDNVGLTITLSLLFSFIVGVLTYYLIEKPGKKLIYKILR